MKKFRFVLVALLMCVAASASAQFANSSKTSAGEGWQGLRISYLPMKITGDGSDFKMTGFSAGYVKSFGIAKNMPVFLEVGGNLSYAFKDLTDEVKDVLEDVFDEDLDGLEVKMNMLSLNIPVNVGYKFDINESISLYPHLGFNFRVNMLGKMKAEYEGESEDVNLFDDDEMNEFEAGDAYKRFNVGFLVGVDCNINRFNVGLRYQKDFTELLEGGKIAMPSISVGYNF